MKLQDAINSILNEVNLQKKELGVNHAWCQPAKDLDSIAKIHQRRVKLKLKGNTSENQ